jgi:lipid A oxidase
MGVAAPVTAFAQWNASAYIGKTHTLKADIHVLRPSDTDIVFKNAGFDDRSFRKPLYYGLRGGYIFKGSAGVEAEFIHIKAFAQLDRPVVAERDVQGVIQTSARMVPAVVIQQYNVSHGLNLLLGNFVLQREITERVDLSLRAGLGVAIPHPEIRAFGQVLERYERQGAAIQFAAGTNLAVTRHLFWLGEYKFTTTNARFQIGSATIQNAFSTHHIVSGFGVRF